MIVAPGTPSSHPLANESGHFPPGEVVVMNRIQIALAREIGGWPLYTIIIALGQVSPLCDTSRYLLLTFNRCWRPTVIR